MLGVIALLFLFWMSFAFFKRAKTPYDKAVAVSMVVWAFSYMSVYGMRDMAPALIFGIAALVPLVEKQNAPLPPPEKYEKYLK
jgi:hypothetical protein